MTEQSTAAFFSGLIQGWISRLEKATYDERQQVYKDMLEESKRLAKYAGVTISDDNL